MSGPLPDELKGFIPKHAVALDIDNVQPEGTQYTLGKVELKDFIRSSWQRSRDIARIVGEELGAANA